MDKNWWYVIIGGLMEVFWVTALKLSNNLTNFKYAILTVILVSISFYLFAKGMENLPSGLAYTIFTGIGAVGTVFFSFFFLHEELNLAKIIFLLILLLGIIGLKVTGNTEE